MIFVSVVPWYATAFGTRSTSCSSHRAPTSTATVSGSRVVTPGDV